MFETLIVFLPGIVATLAGKLLKKDANDTGADDFGGKILTDLSPHLPELIKGSASDTTADKLALALFRTSEGWLRRRGKLPKPPDA